MTTPAPARAWYRDRKQRDRAALYGFAVLGVGGILLAGSLRLAQGDRRVVVVTLQRDDSVSVQELEQRRELLKTDCGTLPGVTVVADQGRSSVQGRFPVRFAIKDATNAERAGLEACVARHPTIVLGYTLEGDE